MEGKALNVLNSSVYHISERAKKTGVGEWQRAPGGEYLKYCSQMGFGSRVSIITNIPQSPHLAAQPSSSFPLERLLELGF